MTVNQVESVVSSIDTTGEMGLVGCNSVDHWIMGFSYTDCVLVVAGGSGGWQIHDDCLRDQENLVHF